MSPLREVATRFVKWIGLFTAGTTVASLGCESLIGADFGAAHLRPKEAGVEGGATCNLLVPPSRPALAPATDPIEFTVVVSAIDLGDVAPDGGVATPLLRGYDMDGVCSTSQATSSCTPQPWIGSVTLDGPRGQDNAVGQLIVDQQKIFGTRVLGSDITNDALTHGVDPPAAVFRIRSYSGFSEDDHVEVDWFVATTLSATTDGGTTTAVSPAFDTTDRWPIFSDTVQNPNVATAADAVSLYRDSNAFVSKRELVAHFDAAQIPMRGVFFDVTDVSLTGDLDRDAVSGEWTIDNAVVEARGSTDGLLSLVPDIAWTLFGVTICTDDQANYPKIKRYVCGAADLPDVKGAPATTPCTGSSVGASIKAAPASLGSLVPRPVRTTCAPTTDPKTDTCAVPVGGQ